MTYTAAIQKLPRKFLPEDFQITDWESLQPYFENLVQRPLNNPSDLESFLLDQSELESVVSEDACWRQIRMTCDTQNKELEESFQHFCLNIQPKIQPYADQLNRKLLACPFINALDESQYGVYFRNIRKRVELFREANIPLQAEMAVLQQQYGQITGAMTVEINGNMYTLQQAAKFLESPDRSIRESVYHQIQQRRGQDREKLDALFDQLLNIRNQEAKNAGTESYTAYRFQELGRFDYGEADCMQFQEAVKQHVVPLVREIHERKRKELGVDSLRPWDLEAEPAGQKPLHPFKNGAELLDKTIQCFQSLNPFFADCLVKMQQMGHLDLESRMGKAPGGYNCPLAESGAPFIFMNAAGQMHDVTTMVHEGGHAVHSFLAHPLPLAGFKEYPMEIAEVASMSMELFTMDHWQPFFPNEADWKRARIHQLERVITLFPWIAIIDKFQHWLYAHPGHSTSERTEAWMQILNEYADGVVDFSGLENYRAYGWQRQLHLYEVPFYYIEYGIAQLGAIGMWMQYRQNKDDALENYCKALALGGTVTLPELYRTAGLTFDFSPSTIEKLMLFVKGELEALG
jgi:oligoendopeptidase F